jgi:hypothetical protein
MLGRLGGISILAYIYAFSQLGSQNVWRFICKETSQLEKQAGLECMHGAARAQGISWPSAMSFEWEKLAAKNICYLLRIYPPRTGLYCLCHTLLSFSVKKQELAFQSPMYSLPRYVRILGPKAKVTSHF